jgi:hypothetical protein
MDKDTLVENRINYGRLLVEELPQRGFPVAAGFWLKPTVDGKWRFYLVSSAVDAEGLTEAYGQLHPVVRAMPQPFWIDPLEIKLIGPSNPIARDAIAYLSSASAPRLAPVPWGGTRLGDVIVDEAYLYPLPASTPRTKKKRA